MVIAKRRRDTGFKLRDISWTRPVAPAPPHADFFLLRIAIRSLADSVVRIETPGVPELDLFSESFAKAALALGWFFRECKHESYAPLRRLA
jgi:hypothetical protein